MADPLGLAGARVAVLGATGTVGGAVTRAFAELGATLVVHGHRAGSGAKGLADALRERYGVDPIAVSGDVTSTAEMRLLRDGLVASGVDGIDVLVVCTTAYGGRPVPVSELDAAEFSRVLDVDVTGTFVAVQALLPLLRSAPKARVVLFSSIAGIRGRTGAAHLCAAKAGVHGLTLALARDLAAHGVRVNCLAPGPVRDGDGPHPPGLTAEGVGVTTPQEVAAAVVMLASSAAPVTGQLLVLNGGRP